MVKALNMNEWRNIETSPPPKDGSAVMLCRVIDEEGKQIEPDTIRNILEREDPDLWLY